MKPFTRCFWLLTLELSSTNHLRPLIYASANDVKILCVLHISGKLLLNDAFSKLLAQQLIYQVIEYAWANFNDVIVFVIRDIGIQTVYIQSLFDNSVTESIIACFSSVW